MALHSLMPFQRIVQRTYVTTEHADQSADDAARRGFIAPVAFASLLFVANHLYLLSAWLRPPAGTHPMFVVRDPDIAQHITWMSAMREHWLIPDFHAPFATVPGLFSPLMLVLGRIAAVGLDPGFVYACAEFVVYIVGGYALFACFGVFLESKLQAYAAAISVFCSLSVMDFIHSLKILTTGVWKTVGPISVMERDGLIQSGPLTIGVGTVLVLLAMALVGSYIQRGRKIFLVSASLIAALSALLHPFEAFAIIAGSALSLAILRWPHWALALREAAVISTPASLLLGLYAFFSLRTGWMLEITRRNQVPLLDFGMVWSRFSAMFHIRRPIPNLAGSSVVLNSTNEGLIALASIPMILAVLLLLLRAPMKRSLDVVLQCWFVATLAILAAPKMPHRMHLWDGMAVITSLLLVRQFFTIPNLTAWFARQRVVLVACGAVIVTLSGATQALHRSMMFASGNTLSGPCSAVALDEEFASIAWLRQHASPEDLVLSPPASAGWIATVPIHTFAGHWLFSFDYATQVRLADRFYAGTMSADEVSTLLAEYGIKYVLMPRMSPARRVLDDHARLANVGTWAIYVYPQNHMQPYSERAFSHLVH